MATALEAPSWREIAASYIFPGQLIMMGIYYCIRTWIQNPLLLIRDFKHFQHKSFAMLWANYGEAMSKEMPVGTAEALGSVSGVALDVGPGSGTQLHYFDPSKIAKMYAVEPASDMHAALSSNATKNGFRADQYEIITAGAESTSLIPALAKMGILKNEGREGTAIFDSIACCRVLCGVPKHAETIEGLYRLLKPGGRLVICEHVVNPWPNGGAFMGRVLQKVYMFFGWRFWLGGCCLDRDTARVVQDVARKDGGWKHSEVKRVNQWSVIPTVVGEFVKR